MKINKTSKIEKLLINHILHVNNSFIVNKNEIPMVSVIAYTSYCSKKKIAYTSFMELIGTTSTSVVAVEQ